MSAPLERVTKSAEIRTRRVVEAIRAAMDLIESEISESEGLYSRNSGRLTMAEVCRRAGVHPITMMGPAHRDTTRPLILAWLDRMSAMLVTGAKNVRGAVTQRAVFAEDQYKLVASKFQAMYQVEIPRRDAEIEKLQSRVADLERENLELREQLSEGRVIRLPKAKP